MLRIGSANEAIGRRAGASAPPPEIEIATVRTPIGVLLLAATERALIRIGLPGEESDFVLTAPPPDASDDPAGPLPLPAPASPLLERAARQLEEYFAGERRTFELPLALPVGAPFHARVLDSLRQLPFGSVTSYTALALAAGNARAVRAAGGACAGNPLPIVVPCHRVLRADGKLGGYRGGVEMKRELLALEGVRTERGLLRG